MIAHALTCAAVVEQLTRASIRHELHTFPSGALMLDIWCKDTFYVVQFDERLLGISKISADNPGFSTIPDELVKDRATLLARIEALLSRC